MKKIGIATLLLICCIASASGAIIDRERDLFADLLNGLLSNTFPHHANDGCCLLDKAVEYQYQTAGMETRTNEKPIVPFVRLDPLNLLLLGQDDKNCSLGSFLQHVQKDIENQRAYSKICGTNTNGHNYTVELWYEKAERGLRLFVQHADQEDCFFKDYPERSLEYSCWMPPTFKLQGHTRVGNSTHADRWGVDALPMAFIIDPKRCVPITFMAVTNHWSMLLNLYNVTDKNVDKSKYAPPDDCKPLPAHRKPVELSEVHHDDKRKHKRVHPMHVQHHARPKIEHLDPRNTIYENILADERLSHLAKILGHERFAQLRELLSSPDANVTLFAPNNHAIEMAKEEFRGAEWPLINATGFYHVAHEEVRVASKQKIDRFVATMVSEPPFVNLNGSAQPLHIITSTLHEGMVVSTGHIDANVRVADIECSNGLMHIIDRVLALPANTTKAVPRAGLQSLTAAAVLAGVIDYVNAYPGGTLFAPSDFAFAMVPGWRRLPVDCLRAILAFHAVPFVARSDQLLDGHRLPTFNGTDLNIKRGPLLDLIYVNDALVTSSDLLTANGVVHVISKVLIPPHLEEQVAAANREVENEGQVNAADADHGSLRSINELMNMVVRLFPA